MRRGSALRKLAAAVFSVLPVITLAGCGGVSGPDPSAFGGGAAPASPASASTPGTCLTQALSKSCELGPNPAGAGTPYELPAASTGGTYTVVARGGGGANGDKGAVGGPAGLIVSTVTVPAGAKVKVWVATNASSFNAGQGYAPGGNGWQAPGIWLDSGGGGGSSAVTVDDQVAVVAAGGGGAGSSVPDEFAYKANVAGGNGGSAGLPASEGGFGQNTSTNTSRTGLQYTFPGKGGCANGGSSGCNAQGFPEPANPQWGGNGYSNVPTSNGGGGGGAGYPNGGDAGGPSMINPLFASGEAGGGGGGGGQNFSATPATVSVSGSGSAGTVMFLPGGAEGVAPVRYTCQYSGGTITNVFPYSVPAGVSTIYAVVAGGNGGATSDPNETGPPGRGAVASGLVSVRQGQEVQAVVGCSGYGRNPSPGNGPSGGGGGAPPGADDGGGGGGGGALILDGTRDALNAGGGGGSGGSGQPVVGQFVDGSGGGDAGLGWGRAGAGNGSAVARDGGTVGGPPGQGASSAQPGGRGDTGTNATFPDGGGGGGGGGNVGGTGGENEAGGGAGGSSYDAQLVTAPAIGMQMPTTVGADGFVVIVPIPATTYNNIALAKPGTAGAGFDGVGNVYDIDAVNRASAGGITPVYFGQIGAGFGWNTPPGVADNWAQDGQTIPVSPPGQQGLIVFGSSTSGPTQAVSTVRFSDGSTQQVTLSFPDWLRPLDLAPNVKEVLRVPRSDGVQASIYAQYIEVPGGKAPVSLTLPPANPGGPTAPTVHVFKAARGGLG